MANEFILRDTAANWTYFNPTLLSNQIGVETNLRNNVNQAADRTKLGDGFTQWNDLAYWNPSGGMVIVGALDCSGNPNYPAAKEGDVYTVSVGGKIGGASGTSVSIGNLIICLTDNAGGTQAAVGTSWYVAGGGGAGTGTVTEVSSANTDIGVATGTTTPVLTLNSSSTPTASKVAKRDANANSSANNFLPNSASVAQAAGTTVLTVGSAAIQRSTGSGGQIYTLPVTSTLAIGQSFIFTNVGSDIVTVNSSGGNLVMSVLPGATGSATVNAITGTAASSWDVATLPSSLLSVNIQTDTTYTLLASDNGRLVTLNNGSGITVTIPASLGAGFSCICEQLGAGQVTFATSSTTLHNRQSQTKIAGQYGAVSLTAYAADTFILAGDTGA